MGIIEDRINLLKSKTREGVQMTDIDAIVALLVALDEIAKSIDLLRQELHDGVDVRGV